MSDLVGEIDNILHENKQLREQNRVLRGWLEKALDHAHQHNEGCLYCGRGEIIDGETTPEHRAECWWYRAQAALTATSQPAQEQCSYCKRPLTDNHSFSYGVPGVPRVYKCDRADCTKPATSQEGQHEAAN